MDEPKMDGSRIVRVTQSIADLLVQVKPPKRVLLFGSRGRGDARGDSDVDLCFIYDHLEKRNVQIMEELHFSLFGHSFLLVYDEATFASRASRVTTSRPRTCSSTPDHENMESYASIANSLRKNI
jgi:predicted nucleotidyltransferase